MTTNASNASNASNAPKAPKAIAPEATAIGFTKGLLRKLNDELEAGYKDGTIPAARFVTLMAKSLSIHESLAPVVGEARLEGAKRMASESSCSSYETELRLAGWCMRRPVMDMPAKKSAWTDAAPKLGTE